MHGHGLIVGDKEAQKAIDEGAFGEGIAHYPRPLGSCYAASGLGNRFFYAFVNGHTLFRMRRHRPRTLHVFGIVCKGTDDRYPLIGSKRQQLLVVFEQHLALLCHASAVGFHLGCVDILPCSVFVKIAKGVLKEAQSPLHFEHMATGFVDIFLANLAFLQRLLQRFEKTLTVHIEVNACF